jgi:hypothetical protein
MNLLRKEIKDDGILSIVEMIGGCDLENGPWIAGGCARLLWFGKPWMDHDVDLFFPNFEKFNLANAALRFHHALDGMSRADDSSNVLLARSSDQLFETDNAITYTTILPSDRTTSAKVQIIRTAWHENLRSVWSNFDFTACKFATDGKVVVADPSAVDDCQRKRLRMNPQSIRRASAIRTLKYSIYGFNADPDIISELISQYRDGTISNDMGLEAYT